MWSPWIKPPTFTKLVSLEHKEWGATSTLMRAYAGPNPGGDPLAYDCTFNLARRGYSNSDWWSLNNGYSWNGTDPYNPAIEGSGHCPVRTELVDIGLDQGFGVALNYVASPDSSDYPQLQFGMQGGIHYPDLGYFDLQEIRNSAHQPAWEEGWTDIEYEGSTIEHGTDDAGNPVEYKVPPKYPALVGQSDLTLSVSPNQGEYEYAGISYRVAYPDWTRRGPTAFGPHYGPGTSEQLYMTLGQVPPAGGWNTMQPVDGPVNIPLDAASIAASAATHAAALPDKEWHPGFALIVMPTEALSGAVPSFVNKQAGTSGFIQTAFGFYTTLTFQPPRYRYQTADTVEPDITGQLGDTRRIFY